MTATARKILEEALTLPEPEREALVEMLSDSLNPSSMTLSTEWQAEVENRIAQIERGEVQPVPWSTVEERIRSCLK